ncbi:MAG: ParB N-terminal domain-containing protein [Oscillospiraceae bacterium]|nr:ParB N-terminal domain-containing protein [Oscillospiraceae bacterium]
MRTEELLRELHRREIVVFGTGFVAERFWLALERTQAADQVSFFMTTAQVPTGTTFHGRPVCRPEERSLDADSLFCLAVHESLLPELEALLPGQLMDRGIWIYPNLWELLCGPALGTGIMLSRRKLLTRQDPGCNWITVRYAAIRDLLRQDPGAAASADRYRRAMAVHCGPATAEKRFRALERLARSVQERGLDPDRPLIVDTHGHILDGLHRFAAACALRIEDIPCTILPVSEVFAQILDDKNRLPDQVLRESGFSERDMEWIRLAKAELIESGKGGVQIG